MRWFPPHVPVGARRARVARVSERAAPERRGRATRPHRGTHHRPQLLGPALVPPSGIVLGLREPPAAGPRVCPQRLRLSPGRPRRRGRRHGRRIGPLSRRRAHPEARAGRLEGHPGRVRGPGRIRSRKTDTPSGKLAKFASRVSTGSVTRIPVTRAFRSSATSRARLSPSPRKAARARCFGSWRRNWGFGSVLWLPVSSARRSASTSPRDPETPRSRSTPGRVSRVRLSASSWLMASGMARGASRASCSPAGGQTSRRRRERSGLGCRGRDLEPPLTAAGRTSSTPAAGRRSRPPWRWGWPRCRRSPPTTRLRRLPTVGRRSV